MLVLNRRPGESIVIEHGICITVLSVVDRKIWIGLELPGIDGSLRLSCAAVSEEETRIEIGAPSSVRFADGTVRIEVAGTGQLATLAEATFLLNRRARETVVIGDDLVLRVDSAVSGSPCLGLEGPTFGPGLTMTVPRAMGNGVRIGIDAPERRVYRQELWEGMTAAKVEA